MSETVGVPGVPLAAVAAGTITVVLTTRAASAVLRVVADEVNYEAGTGELADRVKRRRR